MTKKNHFNAPILIGGMLLIGLFIAGSVNAQDKDKKWVAPETAKKLKAAVPADDENIAAGKALYAKHCKSCHGAGGKGDGPKAANLEKECGDFTKDEFKNQSDGEIFWKTTEGKDPMPTFKKKTSDEERWQIIHYVRAMVTKK
jgi:mono/diheme cytochrome c family protein